MNNITDDFKRMPDETFDDYFVRLFENKAEYGLTCDQIGRILNLESGSLFSESKWRKDFAMFQRGREYEKDKLLDTVAPDLRQKQDELYRSKVQYQDQRREYNALLRTDARVEHFYDELIKAAHELPEFAILPCDIATTNAEAVVCLSDWHYGLVADNVFNSYNPTICRQRLERLSGRVRNYLEMYRPKRLHVLVLGDLWHGAIHTAVRLAACENTVSQIMNSCELLAHFIASVAEMVPATDVYCTYGNHARVIPNKKESQHGDNLEKLVPFWLKERFANTPTINIVEQELDGFIVLNVLGYGIVATHGDLENFPTFGTTMHTVLSKKYGVNIDYAIMGDKHHLESKDATGVEAIICPSLCGTDDHADGKRLYSTPGQLMLIVNPVSGAESRMMIRLD